MDEATLRARAFYACLRDEVMGKNPVLNDAEQARLQSHYAVMMQPQRYRWQLASAIYAARRRYPAQAILDDDRPRVFDAGCGYGSESFFFASLGAKVLAVDLSAAQVAIAKKRQVYFEEKLGRSLDITFEVADLDDYCPSWDGLAYTWLASVFAAIPHQDRFLERVHRFTKQGGRVGITDMNLLNPLFLLGEVTRRRACAARSQAFFQAKDFMAMFSRRGREGARYFLAEHGDTVDDVQFFHAYTLAALLRSTGFVVEDFAFSGFVPPAWSLAGVERMEMPLSKVPGLRHLGYFYVVTGQRKT